MLYTGYFLPLSHIIFNLAYLSYWVSCTNVVFLLVSQSAILLTHSLLGTQSEFSEFRNKPNHEWHQNSVVVVSHMKVIQMTDENLKKKKKRSLQRSELFKDFRMRKLDVIQLLTSQWGNESLRHFIFKIT